MFDPSYAGRSGTPDDIANLVLFLLSDKASFIAGTVLFADGAAGAVTLIQRFGSALNLNIHFHILFLDGVYVYRDNRPPRFQRVNAPEKAELEELVQLINQRVGRCGGSVRVIASIEEQDVIDRILTHLRQKEQETPTRPLLVPPTRAPPGA